MSGINLSIAVDVPITCKRGDTFIIEDIEFYSDSAYSVPRNITGYTFKLVVADRDGTIILTFLNSEFSISGADNNLLSIRKEAADMLVDASVIGRPYLYDLEMTDTDSIVTTIMKGNFAIEQDLTNA